MAVSSFGVAAPDRIEIYTHPIHRPAFVRQASGEWRYENQRPEPTPSLQVERPARIGGAIRFWSTDAGEISLEEEGADSPLAVTTEHPASSWGQLPTDLAAKLRADKRYRLRSHDLTSAWFHPAAITDDVWQTDGVLLHELHVYEAQVRQECGSVRFRTRIELEPGFTAERLEQVAFVAITSESTPLIALRGGHTWLVPERVSRDVKSRPPRSTVCHLSVPVPLSRDLQLAGKWIHVQLAVLATDGSVLAATGVRSVAILPDAKPRDLRLERSFRERATRFWEHHGVSDAVEFWERLVSR
jgi:hypothetical protein